MKVIKGNPEYIKKRKKSVMIKAFFEFGIVLALLILGIIETGSRMNVLTIVAVLGCLPASKALVEVIMLFPHHSVAEDIVTQIQEKAEFLTVAYDMVITSKDKIMPIDCVAISDNTICGYTSSSKVDIVYAAKYIKQILGENQFQKVSVKIFNQYEPFLTRIADMNGLAETENQNRKKEERIRQVILNISL